MERGFVYRKYDDPKYLRKGNSIIKMVASAETPENFTENQRTAYDLLVGELRQAMRCKRSLSITLLDVKNLWMIENYYGLEGQRRFLQIIERKGRHNIRREDLFIHLHRGTFLLLLREASSDNAVIITRRVVALLELYRTKAGKVRFHQAVVEPTSPGTTNSVIEEVESETLNANRRERDWHWKSYAENSWVQGDDTWLTTFPLPDKVFD